MNSEHRRSQTLNNLIDATDTLLPTLTGDEAWSKSVELVKKAGGNALNVAELERDTGAPIWFRSSMTMPWLDDYFEQEFFTFDPVIIAACQGQLVSRMSKGRVHGCDEVSERTNAYSDQIVHWGYHTLDYHVFATDNQNALKGLAFSHGADSPAPTTNERLLCAVIASVVYAPKDSKSPGATPMLRDALTTREKDVLRYLATGMRNDAIAWKLGIAEITVRVHITSARRKLGAATREQAIALAIRSGQLLL